MQNSILLMLVIIIPAQLVSQLLALPKMLDFLELPFLPKYTVVYPSLAFEFIGLTHCAYFIKVCAFVHHNTVPHFFAIYYTHNTTTTTATTTTTTYRHLRITNCWIARIWLRCYFVAP